MRAIVDKWRTSRGTPLAPTTMMSYVTALIVGADTCLRSPVSLGRDLEVRRLLHRITQLQATHIRKQAAPISRRALVRCADAASSPRAGLALRMAWLMGLRIADLFRIHGKDLVEVGKRAAIVRVRGAKGQQAGRRAYYRLLSLRGMGRPLRKFVASAQLHPEVRLFPTTTATEVKRALKAAGFSLHSVRRGTATCLRDAGASTREIRDWLGHADSSTIRCLFYLQVHRQTCHQPIRCDVICNKRVVRYYIHAQRVGGK
jgi:integrase